MEAGEELVEAHDDQEESIEEQETEEEKQEEKSIELELSERQPASREGGEVNYRLQVLEEICLEGLEGITLQVLTCVATLVFMCGYISFYVWLH